MYRLSDDRGSSLVAPNKLVPSKDMLDEAVFRHAADNAIDDLFRALTRAADSHDFDTDLNNGALTIEFDDPPAKFVVSPNAPVRQIWVSAHSRSFKLDWNGDEFAMPGSGESLRSLMSSHISEQLGEEVAL